MRLSHFYVFLSQKIQMKLQSNFLKRQQCFWMLVGSKSSETNTGMYKGWEKITLRQWEGVNKKQNYSSQKHHKCSKGQSNNILHRQAGTQFMWNHKFGYKAEVPLGVDEAVDRKALAPRNNLDVSPEKCCAAEERQVKGRFLFNCRWARKYFLASNQEQFSTLHPSMY